LPFIVRFSGIKVILQLNLNFRNQGKFTT